MIKNKHISDVKIIVIGGSAGSYNVVRNLLSSLPDSFHHTIVLCLHRLRDIRHGLAESMNQVSKRPVVEPEDKTFIKPDHVYLAPSNYHLLFDNEFTIALSDDELVNFSRPSLDITFESAASIFGPETLAILLSGANADGAAGIKSCHVHGAYTIVQDPEDAQFGTMPEKALRLFKPDQLLSEEEIIEFIISHFGKSYHPENREIEHQ